MEEIKLTREELYNLVWSIPLLTLSKRYIISDVGLRKICIKMEIPLPKAGHWQKLYFNKKISKPELSSDYKGQHEISLKLRTNESCINQTAQALSKIHEKQIEEEMKLMLDVPGKLTNPNKLVITARESLNDKTRYEYRGLISCRRDELDITVSRSNIPRALRFMNTLIKLLEARGHSVEIQNSDTYVIINQQRIKVQLREKLKREIVKGKYGNDSVYQPTGILAFQITSYPNKEWKDGSSMIETLLSKIIAKVELMAEEKEKQEVEIRKQLEIRKEQERIRINHEKKREKDLEDFKDVLSKAARWHKAINLRNYIKEVEVKAKNENRLGDELKLWLQWAKQKADWYDPFTEMKDELLDNIDRKTLEPIRKSYF